MNWMILPLKRYFDFSGRSRRKEYWLFILFTFLANIVLSILDAVLGTLLIFSGLFGLFVLIPSIAVAVRRLHDTDRSGWWLLAPALLYLVGIALAAGGAVSAIAAGATNPFGAAAGIALIFMGGALITGLVVFVFLLLDGTRGSNRFGPDPKDPAGSTDLQEVFR